MKIDVAKIEQQIYYDICKNFSNWCEMQLNKYKPFLKWLETITFEQLTEIQIKDLYNDYVNFCENNSFNTETKATFTTTINSFGFYAFATHSKEVNNGKTTLSFFRPISQKRK